ncbi:hypothetical protein [Palleronia sp. LCG004]|uniref:hypothetical protein n=1 Tax=Palleronia sp. LCG004 TaxID=3079304 RepID=UPI002943BA4D|nr:hypothetical protein [Palleronia sp. LCG004]WOI54860.1 hypothetical protein RVY76_07230 [Palleronia sp. LCG004]
MTSIETERLKLLKVLAKLSLIRTAWDASPTPNTEADGFNFSDATKLIHETRILEDCTLAEAPAVAQEIRDKIDLPTLDITEPSQSLLLAHYRLSETIRLLGSIAGENSGDKFEILENDYEADLHSIRISIQEIRAILENLEEQSSETVLAVNQTLISQKNQSERQFSLDSVGFSAFGVSVPLGAIRHQVAKAERHLASHSQIDILGISDSLDKIRRTSKSLFDRIKETSGIISRNFAISVGRMSQKASEALLVAKRTIRKELTNRKELSSQSFSGSFTDSEYKVDYLLNAASLSYLENFLTTPNLRNREAFLRRYFSESKAIDYYNRSIQDEVFQCFELYRGTEKATKIIWPWGYHRDANISHLQTAVRSLLIRVENHQSVAPLPVNVALMQFGYGFHGRQPE